MGVTLPVRLRLPRPPLLLALLLALLLTPATGSSSLRQVDAARAGLERSGAAAGASNGRDTVVLCTPAAEAPGGAGAEQGGLPRGVARIDDRAVAVGRGFLHDVTTVLDALREAARDHRRLFGEPISAAELAAAASLKMHRATLTGSRPFACELLIAAVERPDGGDGAPVVSLCHVGLDGLASDVTAAAIGRQAAAHGKVLEEKLPREATELSGVSEKRLSGVLEEAMAKQGNG
uniref:Uncharacterized protein n=2 Tax=Phaeomonas parva TaxID=124430 RepID=A0A7S1UJJ9_9STRA|mmetsp:Transcript_873/g.2352  ORF Transcript_873/g.2352 Transcript_873/m.2352 type:complete len:234 (+) Transcript_873:242-943(+)